MGFWSRLNGFFTCAALLFGLSLICLWSISVAPVRGGTYFSLPPQRKVGKRKRLKPLILKRVSWLGGGSGASGISDLAHSAQVTRPSYFRQRCARRGGTSSNRWPCSAAVVFHRSAGHIARTAALH